MACQGCRTRKIKCDGARPSCDNCNTISIPCNYAGERRRRTWTTERERVRQSGKRSGSEIQSSPTDLGKKTSVPPETRLHAAIDTYSTDSISPGIAQESVHHNASCPELYPRDQHNGCFSHGEQFQQHEPDVSSVSPGPSSTLPTQDLLDKLLNGDDDECNVDGGPALWLRANHGYEYTGPSSGISSLSDMGLKCLQQYAPESGRLRQTIHAMRRAILTHLRYPRCVPDENYLRQQPEDKLHILPSSQMATFIDAYFNKVQVMFPILQREIFEEQLAKYGTKVHGNSHSWLALISAVIASGCRAALSDESPEAFKEAAKQSWPYFEDALAYERNLFHGAADLTSVQALAVMTVFAQGMSSPVKLEYSISSSASRLALSLALNLREPSCLELTESESQERRRVFWVVYCLDKTIALRCGRPAVIQDEDISCCFPRIAHRADKESESINYRGRMADHRSLEFLLHFTRFARICGNIYKQLYTAAALCAPASYITKRRDQLLHELDTWIKGMPQDMQPGIASTHFSGAGDSPRIKMVALHMSYFYALCAIHRRFTVLFRQNDESMQQIPPSTGRPCVIEAARSIALLTKYLDVESSSPNWLALYYPVTSLTTIFLSLVVDPSSISARQDVALIETLIGYLGRVEYVTSGEKALTGVSEYVHQARSIFREHNNTTVYRAPFQAKVQHDPTSSNLESQTASNASSGIATDNATLPRTLSSKEWITNELDVLAGMDWMSDNDNSIDNFVEGLLYQE